LYQCSYLLGALQLKALREEVVGRGKMSDGEFNDTILELELIRDGMLNLPLARNTRASWKFAGDRPAVP
jgi:hypothetical protein